MDSDEGKKKKKHHLSIHGNLIETLQLEPSKRSPA